MQLQIDASGSRESIALILSRKFGMAPVSSAGSSLFILISKAGLGEMNRVIFGKCS
jgi:hypothetical protein